VGPANQAVQVVSESPGARVAWGNRVAPVVPVALDQQHVPAAARARSPQHDRAGVAPIKLATAVYQAGGAKVHSAAAAAAIVATLRAPAAAVAARVWAAAGTAVVAAVMVVAAGVVVAAEAVVVAAEEEEEAGDESTPRSRYETMNYKWNVMNRTKTLLIASGILLGTSVITIAAEPKENSATAKQANQKQFASPKEAADALLQAAALFDQAALKEILGPESDDIIASEDPVQDKNRAVAFAAMAKEKTNIEKKGDHAILEVGKDDFPLPIPIVNRKGKWAFDTKIGKEEIINRRIGANELDAITICRGFDDAQKEYAAEKHDDSKVNQYAQKIISTPGKHDGLAWKNADGTWGGPVGEEVAKALEQGYTEKEKPYHGYYFKVLRKQGSAAPMGEMDFVIEGAMIGGFALVAAPAEYRVTGVKTFMVGPDGVVYEKDLGADTLKTFQGMDTYNPDKTWKVTEDEWPEEEEGTPAEEPSPAQSPD